MKQINSWHVRLVLQACNPKYEDFEKTSSICVSENINNTLTRYRWLVSAPTGPDGVTSPMKEVDFDTFFTSSKMITLDSIYFQAGSRVQCAARAVNSDGNEGLELLSPIVTISTSEGKTSSPAAKFTGLFWIPNSVLTKAGYMIRHFNITVSDRDIFSSVVHRGGAKTVLTQQSIV